MPRASDGEFAFPPGFEEARDSDGKVYFIDHNTRKTSWVDPRDRLNKPMTFADCVGDELPFGWEEAYDASIGVYFINHITHTNQREDPRLVWRKEQEFMLKDYLQTTGEEGPHPHLTAPPHGTPLSRTQNGLPGGTQQQHRVSLGDIQEQPFHLSQEEIQRSNEALSGWQSHTSLNSNSSSGSTKYDPDLLKAQVAHAKARVAQIKNELLQVQAQIFSQEAGMSPALSQLSQNHHSASMMGLHHMKPAMSDQELLQSLSRHGYHVSSTSSLPTSSSHPLLTSGSQQDLAHYHQSHHQSVTAQQLRLHNQDPHRSLSVGTLSSSSSRGSLGPSSRGSLASSKGSLNSALSSSELNNSPGVMKDIIQKVDALLQGGIEGLDYQSMSTTPHQGMPHPHYYYHQYQQQQQQQQQQYQQQQQQQQYHQQQQHAHHNVRQGDPSMPSLSPRSSLSSISPPASPGGGTSQKAGVHQQHPGPQYEGRPPTYHQHLTNWQRPINNNQTDHNHHHQDLDGEQLAAYLSQLQLSMQDPSQSGAGGQGARTGYLARPGLDLRHATSEYSSQEGFLNSQLSPISEGTGLLPGQSVAAPRSVSAAVSDESMAGDSGVYEASARRPGEVATDEAYDPVTFDLTQLLLECQYDSQEGLVLTLDSLQNLRELLPTQDTQFFIKGNIQPCPPNSNLSFQTPPLQHTGASVCPLGHRVTVSIQEAELHTMTLQLYICYCHPDGMEDCLAGTQLSLLDACLLHPGRPRWYTLLNFTQPAYPQHDVDTSSEGTATCTSTLERSSQLGTSTHSHMSDIFDTALPVESRLRATSLDTSVLSYRHPPPAHQASSPAHQSVSEATHNENQPTSPQRASQPHPAPPHSLTTHHSHHPTDPGFTDDPISAMTNGYLDSVTAGGNGAQEDETSRSPSPGINKSLGITRSRTFGGGSSDGIIKPVVPKLNRSESDGAMVTGLTGPFKRNSLERTSMRWKKPQGSPSSQRTGSRAGSRPGSRAGSGRARSTGSSRAARQQIEALKTQEAQLKDDLLRFREIKRQMEESRSKGEKSPHSRKPDSDILKKLLDSAEQEALRRQHQREAEQRQEQPAEQRLEQPTDQSEAVQSLEQFADQREVEQRLEQPTDQREVEQRLEQPTDQSEAEQRMIQLTDQREVEQRQEQATDQGEAEQRQEQPTSQAPSHTEKAFLEADQPLTQLDQYLAQAGQYLTEEEQLTGLVESDLPPPQQGKEVLTSEL